MSTGKREHLAGLAAIQELLKEVTDLGLRQRLEAEVARLSKQKRFGLVYEEHLPEASPMPGVKIRVGITVATRAQDRGALFVVKSLSGAEACCVAQDGCEYTYPVKDLVAVSKFGEPIYPYLEPIAALEHGGGDLWHTLIQADNYHALQLLEYLYPGQVDCIYIDPPYNTGAKDWKYNNDYVDSNDAWRHSKWLSMMEKRLALAKRLLNPNDSVMIVTIDEKEYLHLGMLLEQMFPEARIQMVSSVINPSGVAKVGEFSRTDEYLFFVKFGLSAPQKIELSSEWSSSAREKKATEEPCWRTLRRRGSNDLRQDRPNMFYPVFVKKETGKIISFGEPLRATSKREYVVAPASDIEVVWPLKPDGTEGRWQIGREEANERLSNGYVRVVSRNAHGWIPTYLATGEVEKIQHGVYAIMGRGGANNEVQISGSESDRSFIPGSQWRISSHNAREQGSVLLNNILNKRFSFPKSLYAVHDAIRFFVANKPNALIVDFFAGSGTTLHAVNLLNAEDGGHRRCILVTNNEVSEAEAEAFRRRGVNPGDPEWEAKGIAQYVTWPRTTCAIKGVNVKGEALKGEYINAKGGALGDRALPMADGFKANAAFFRLGFLDATSVGLGRRFNELLPVLWMKAGAQGACPKAIRPVPDDMLVLPENRMAVLFDESAFGAFKKAVRAAKTIDTLFVVTDYDPSYRALVKAFPAKRVYALYRDYLDTFRINAVRMRG